MPNMFILSILETLNLLTMIIPANHHLPPKIKDKMRGVTFASPNDAVIMDKTLLSAVSLETGHKCFSDWFERMQKCINTTDEYFGKQ